MGRPRRGAAGPIDPKPLVERMRKLARKAARAGLFDGDYEAAIEDARIELWMRSDTYGYMAEMGRMYGEGDTPEEALDALDGYLSGVIRELGGQPPYSRPRR